MESSRLIFISSLYYRLLLWLLRLFRLLHRPVEPMSEVSQLNLVGHAVVLVAIVSII